MSVIGRLNSPSQFISYFYTYKPHDSTRLDATPNRSFLRGRGRSKIIWILKIKTERRRKNKTENHFITFGNWKFSSRQRKSINGKWKMKENCNFLFWLEDLITSFILNFFDWRLVRLLLLSFPYVSSRYRRLQPTPTLSQRACQQMSSKCVYVWWCKCENLI